MTEIVRVKQREREKEQKTGVLSVRKATGGPHPKGTYRSTFPCLAVCSRAGFKNVQNFRTVLSHKLGKGLNT